MSTFIRDLHVQALEVVAGLDAALLFMPVYGKEGHSPKLVQRLNGIRREAQRMLDLTGDKGGLEQVREPDLSDADALRDELLEAVRAQDATVTLELYGGARSDRVSKTIENYPVPRIPVVGDEFLLDDGSLARVVVPVRLVGRAAIVRAQVWATLPDSEKF